jgi:hypothetical protein
MRTLFIAIAAAAAPLVWPARAADPVWEPLAGAGDGAYVEIDRTSLALREGWLTVWLRFSFAEPVRGRVQSFRSAVAQHAIDCRGRRHAAMRMTTYSDRLGDGDVIDRWDDDPQGWAWRAESAGAADAMLVRLACAQAPAIAFSMPMTMSPP